MEKVIDSILKESRMTQEEFNEVKWITLEMKSSRQSKVIASTPIVVVGPSKGLTIAQPCAQAPITPYAIVAQVQPVRTRSDQPRRQPGLEGPIT